ncbi:MAG: deoxyribonuclease IV [Candidatus Limnocylindrales bacterium]
MSADRVDTSDRPVDASLVTATATVGAAPACGRRIQLPGGRRAGPHLPVSLGLLKAADRAAEIGASALQIFSDNPTAWRRRPEPPPEAAAFRRRLAELDIEPLAIHAAYLVNLAGSDEALVDRSVEVLRHELVHAPAFGARFVNVHAGSHRGAGVEAGLARLVDGLARALAETPDGPAAPLVVVENSSGGGDSIGVTVEELAAVLDGAARRGVAGRLRFCLDTAHLWGAGYDVADPAEVDRILTRFDRLIGLDRLAIIHFNDTDSEFGSSHDRHAHLGEGQIGTAGMAHLLCHPALDRVAFYLETPDMENGFDAVNMARLGDLVWGRPLTQSAGV